MLWPNKLHDEHTIGFQFASFITEQGTVDMNILFKLKMTSFATNLIQLFTENQF